MLQERERYFPNTELSDADLSRIKLDGTNFEDNFWFPDANFSGASLRDTSFLNLNLKCVNFSNSDLAGAIFELAAIEAINAMLEGVKVNSATFYGCKLAEGNKLASW